MSSNTQDFIALIQNKQLENTLKLAKQLTVKIGNKTYHKRSLSAKQWREIIQLSQKMVDAQTELEKTDFMIEMREKGALYYFGIPSDIFDINYEKLSPLIEGCILRSNMGANSDIDFDDMLTRFEKYNNPDMDSINGSSSSTLKPKEVINVKRNN